MASRCAFPPYGIAPFGLGDIFDFGFLPVVPRLWKIPAFRKLLTFSRDLTLPPLPPLPFSLSDLLPTFPGLPRVPRLSAPRSLGTFKLDLTLPPIPPLPLSLSDLLPTFPGLPRLPKLPTPRCFLD